ncbi:MAG: TonB-dependent receptor plug domain-containing protein, partial [Bacteroidota bacterium]|nr:TonB-dependent receptor plug domain-containing protein [Bacteroidota bacterium]
MNCNQLKLKGYLLALPFCLFLLHAFNGTAQEVETKGANQAEGASAVRGLVQSSTNEPLAGVSVTVRNTKNNFTSGTTTDNAGMFTFPKLPSGGPYSFTFSAVGYEEQTLSGYNIKENISLSLAVKLMASTKTMEQVVVVGYGTQKRKDLTGSVASVGSKDIKELAVTRVDQALSGKVAGVQVKAVSGEPGAPPQINIRGIGSISAGTGPLYVVDGFPTSNIETLNPNDIESLDILKDASATAIYGSRGSNGVVIINTRRGRAGKPVITFDTYTGWQKVAKRPKFMTAMEQARYYYDGIRNRNIDEGRDVSGHYSTWFRKVPQEAIDVLEGRNTYDVDALDVVLRTAPQKQYQMTATGGNENLRYALSGEYFDQEGIVINSGFKRYSVRANMDAVLSKRLTVKMNLNPSFTEARNIQAAGAGTGPN